MFERGKIILVPFPFTDLSAQKVRPALIVSTQLPGSDDIVAVFISSKLASRQYLTDIVVSADDPVFFKTGLKTSSTIRVDKIATLNKQIVLGELGGLPNKYFQQLETALKRLFEIR